MIRLSGSQASALEHARKVSQSLEQDQINLRRNIDTADRFNTMITIADVSDQRARTCALT